MDVGNCEPSALGEESRQFVLACGLGVEKTNKVPTREPLIGTKFSSEAQAFMPILLVWSNT